MRDRITIRRTATREWTVRFPPVGFGAAEVQTRATHHEAVRLAAKRIRSSQHGGSVVATLDQAWNDSSTHAATCY